MLYYFVVENLILDMLFNKTPSCFYDRIKSSLKKMNKNHPIFKLKYGIKKKKIGFLFI